MNIALNDSSVPFGFVIFLKVSISLTCIASSIGSFLIILSYFLFKDIRTIPRQLLLNLSLADLLTALANLFGLLFNFSSYYKEDSVPKQIQGICKAQASASTFATDASILWTIIIAVYMFMVIVIKKPTLASKILPVYYIVSWGVPVAITVWIALIDYFGYDSETAPGWCTIISTKFVNSSSNGTHEVKETYPIVIGYMMFVYLAFIILPVLYIAIRCHVKILISRVNNGSYQVDLQTVAKLTDLKMIFIPIIFIVIRIWSIVVDGIEYFADRNVKNHFQSTTIGAIFILAKGIGDSSQGFANSILFVGLTKAVRLRLWLLVKKTFAKCFYCCRYRKSQMMTSMSEETTLTSDNQSIENGYGVLSDSFQISNTRPSIQN